jgi:hypothetical protein
VVSAGEWAAVVSAEEWAAVVSAQAANSERSQAGLIFEAMINAAPFLRLASVHPEIGDFHLGRDKNE